MRVLLLIFFTVSVFVIRPNESHARPERPAVLPSDTITVAIFHSNDVYGQLVRRNSSDGPVGGMAPRVHLIRQARRAGSVVVLDAGNALGPEPLSVSDQGATMITLMRLAGYAALLPANHEFNFGLETLRQRQAQAGFPFLGSNLSGHLDGDSLFTGHLLVETAGPRIGILGLISREVATLTKPDHFNGIKILDPIEAAVPAVRTLREQGAEYVIALIHMRESDALAFARQVSGIDLIIAGGYHDINRPDHVPSVIRLVNGAQIVTTPGYGAYLGRVTVEFIRQNGEIYLPVRTESALLRVDQSIPANPEAASIIVDLERRYIETSGDTLGSIAGDTRQEQAQIVAQLMRAHTDAEIGILNQGVIRQIPSGKPLLRRDLDRFIRFPNILVKLELTGKQLRQVVAYSQTVDRPSAGMVFAGFDPGAMTVEGRPLRDDEHYRVVVTDFLAGGGDGYRVFTQGISTVETNVDLRTLVQEALQDQGTLSSKAYRSAGRRGIWHSGWEIAGAFERNFVDETTESYRAQNETAPFLSGTTTVAWNSAMRYFLEYETSAHVLRYQNGLDFGQIGRSFGDLTPSSDQIDAEVRYQYRTRKGKIDPFVSTGINTAFTHTNGQRPMLVLGSVGFQRLFFRRLVVRLAGRGQRDFAADKNDFGTELSLEMTQSLKSGGRLVSRVRSFVGVTDRRVVSVENYNTLSFPLLGTLRLNVRQNNFLYRVNRIRGVPAHGVAFRTNLTIGFAYGLDWKWL